MRKLAMLLAIVIVVSVAVAQAPQGPPKPGPEHKKMEYMIGKWTRQADSQDSVFGPGGKSTGTETCKWMTGGFHVECHSVEKGPAGEVTGHGIMGYDAEEKKYTYYNTDSMGSAFLAKGTVAGNVWTWTATMRMAGKAYNVKYVETVAASGRTFKADVGEGSAMKPLMQGTATRAK